MKEEITRALDVLKDKRHDVQLELHSLFSYGKWHSDKQFVSMGQQVEKLKKIQAQIETLESIVQTRKTNEKTTTNKTGTL